MATNSGHEREDDDEVFMPKGIFFLFHAVHFLSTFWKAHNKDSNMNFQSTQIILIVYSQCNGRLGEIKLKPGKCFAY